MLVVLRDREIDTDFEVSWPRAANATVGELVDALDARAGADGVWIDNAVAGSIYMISGELRNVGSSRLTSPALAVELLDGEGRTVTDLPVPLEAPHSRRNLRELAPAELPHGRSPGSGRAIVPGASVPFQAEVGPVPTGAHSYRVVDAPPSLRRAVPKAPLPAASPAAEPKRERPSGSRELLAERDPGLPDPVEGDATVEVSPSSVPAAAAPGP